LEAERKLPAITAAAGVDGHQARAMRTVALRQAYAGPAPALPAAVRPGAGRPGVVEAVLAGLPAPAARRRPVTPPSAEVVAAARECARRVVAARRADAARLGRLAAVTGRVVDELDRVLARVEAGWESWRLARGRAAGLGRRDRGW
jgi:hypothetical protein